ncbi:MAG: rRNA pseudouridine synthase [Flavobacteriales bacterium]|nr:rRNA pseudouridine synthase [Flavobacteriales bacterium]
MERGNKSSGTRKLRPRKTSGNKVKVTQKRKQLVEPDEFRLNKYISNAGVCSRRDADELIAAGRVTVNGEVVNTLGAKVKKTDKVTVDGKTLSLSSKAYIILNKPKDYITTTQDPQGRRTVMDLVKDVDIDRMYPVGRLDRNTTGVLLFTNDGQLAQRLIHPKRNIKKVYSATLDKPLSSPHYDRILGGVKLEDGMMKADQLAYIDPNDKSKVGIEIHSGRNRVVRRMFEALGYEVVALDRVLFGSLDKVNLPRGKWRNLTDKELRSLKSMAGLA